MRTITRQIMQSPESEASRNKKFKKYRLWILFHLAPGPKALQEIKDLCFLLENTDNKPVNFRQIELKIKLNFRIARKKRTQLSKLAENARFFYKNSARLSLLFPILGTMKGFALFLLCCVVATLADEPPQFPDPETGKAGCPYNMMYMEHGSEWENNCETCKCNDGGK